MTGLKKVYRLFQQGDFAGAQEFIAEQLKSYSFSWSDLHTILVESCRRSNYSTVKFLADKKLDVQADNDQALYNATGPRLLTDSELVVIHTGNNGEINEQKRRQEDEQIKIVQLLFERGASIKNRGATIINRVIQSKLTKLVIFLLSQGTTHNKKRRLDVDRRKLLDYAYTVGAKKIYKHLLLSLVSIYGLKEVYDIMYYHRRIEPRHAEIINIVVDISGIMTKDKLPSEYGPDIVNFYLSKQVYDAFVINTIGTAAGTSAISDVINYQVLLNLAKERLVVSRNLLLIFPCIQFDSPLKIPMFSDLDREMMVERNKNMEIVVTFFNIFDQQLFRRQDGFKKEYIEEIRNYFDSVKTELKIYLPNVLANIIIQGT
jgi:hypothetical protein